MKHLIIIGHPKRCSEEISINNIKYHISFDGFKDEKHNEDPFIWNDNFLYTFCHTNDSLSSDVRAWIENKEEVYFVFVAKVNDEEKSDILEIDAIIKAKEVYKWSDKGQRDKCYLPSVFNEKVKRYHLPDCHDGHLTEHDKVTLFTCIGDEFESFLPMKKARDGNSYMAYRLCSDISKDILQLITVNNNRAYYVAKETTPRLKDNKKQEIFKRVSNKIFSIIEKCKQDEKTRLMGWQIKNGDEPFRKKDDV